MPDGLSSPEVSWIWADRQRGMQTLLEFVKEANSWFKGLRCRSHTLVLLRHSNLSFGSSTISAYSSLTIKFASLIPSHVMALATGCTSDGTTANRRNEKQTIYCLHAL